MPPRLRLAERIGRAIGFSPEGRPVRVWVKSRPGEEDAEIVPATVVQVGEEDALLDLGQEVDGLRRVRVRPVEPGWGLHALWLAFIAVDVFAAQEADADPLARWWIRLGRP